MAALEMQFQRRKAQGLQHSTLPANWINNGSGLPLTRLRHPLPASGEREITSGIPHWIPETLNFPLKTKTPAWGRRLAGSGK